MGVMQKIDPKYIQAVVAVEWPAWEPGGTPGHMMLSSWDGQTEYVLIKLFTADSWREHHMLVLPKWIEEAYIVEPTPTKPVSKMGWLKVIAFLDPHIIIDGD